MNAEVPSLEYERSADHEQLRTDLMVKPWIDPVVEAHGFGPRSLYVETCWLQLLGPTATWLYRRLGTWAEANPDGLQVDLVDLAVSLGLGEGLGRSSLLAKSMGRLARFQVARWDEDALAVRRALAPLPERQARRLSYSARLVHDNVTGVKNRLGSG